MLALPFRLALAQINCTVGDFAGNAEKIAAWSAKAEAARADLVLFPELALTGYPPEDLLLKPSFIDAAEQALKNLARRLPSATPALVGTVERRAGLLYNVAALLWRGGVRALYRKQHLPNYGVFDEKRYFTPGDKPLLLDMGGHRLGVTVCEDIWVDQGPARDAARLGASLILNISSSPYHAGKLKVRHDLLKKRAKECRAFFAYCNLVGGQDELVFDGASFITDAAGRVLAQAPQFEEALITSDILPPAKKRARAPAARVAMPSQPGRPPLAADKALLLEPEAEVYAALVLGTRDYVRKNGFQKTLIGLSGGIDSSLVACIAVDALGKENVVGVTLPSRFNVAETRADAKTIAENLGIEFHSLPIEPVVEKSLDGLAPLFAGRPPGLAEENLQARVRGTLLMALSNKFGWMVLTTGNKSETSVGYSTLYGDTAGGFAVIKDVPKTLVYPLSRWRNQKAGSAVIPQSVFDRPPTAELRANQTDQDSLPPYETLDKIIRLYVEEEKSLEAILRAGIDRPTAERVLRLIDANEYKRRQQPPGVKITPRAFGRDRRMPITNKFIQTLRDE